jgi:hypothetical protein
MHKDLDEISILIRYYRIRERLYIDRPCDHRYLDFEEVIIKLYISVLDYETHLLGYLNMNPYTRAARSTVKLGDWKGLLGKVQSADAVVQGYT